jgi:hypothetical protein
MYDLGVCILLVSGADKLFGVFIVSFTIKAYGDMVFH